MRKSTKRINHDTCFIERDDQFGKLRSLITDKIPCVLISEIKRSILVSWFTRDSSFLYCSEDYSSMETLNSGGVLNNREEAR